MSQVTKHIYNPLEPQGPEIYRSALNRTRADSQMIVTAIKSMLRDIDKDGSLIPVSSLNDNSDKLNLLSLVVKTKPRLGCFWMKPKYKSKGFTLIDVLKPGDPKALSPSFKKTDLVDHSGTFGDKKELNAHGKVEGLFADFKLNMGLNISCDFEVSFGKLTKEEVEVKTLLNHSKDRCLDMTHPMVKQSCVKPRTVLCVLVERIMTSDPCLVMQKVQKGGNMSAKVNISSDPIDFEKACLKQGVSKQIDSKVSLKIPEYTVIAFSLIELWVKRDGKFELCLLSDKGGFEQVKPDIEFEEDGRILGGNFDANSFLDLNQELENLSDHFQLLSVLPVDTRSSLLQLLRDAIEDRQSVSVLESVLDQICDGDTPDLSDLEDSERKTIQAIVDLVNQVFKDITETRSSVFSAIHLVLSAMDEMPDEGLFMLGSCCSPSVLKALNILVQHVAAGDTETLPLRDMAALTEDDKLYERIQCLFDLSNITLKRDKDILRAEMKDQPGYISLVMCIAVKGLASLV
ncbi:hypothetical protein UPYG_G00157050 [Umbra pygmaea]|uniref:Non-syndromic hearing impairment protein 5 homolog n=1 Tax=Umbra pygmaea TaxID=75934 RepID=A0ABD0XEH8_UMBPY